MMMCCGGTPASSNPWITAATTAGRVPLSMPAAENTLMPTTSWVETRLRQAAATVAWPVKFVRPRSSITCTHGALG